MRVDMINPFIKSVVNLFDTMLKVPISCGDIKITNRHTNPQETVAIVGLCSPVHGTVLLAFPFATAENLVTRMIGKDLPNGTEAEEVMVDTLAEIVNIVAGSAKGELLPEGSPLIELSLPTVIRGYSGQVDSPTKSAWLEVPYASELGSFRLRVTFETSQNIVLERIEPFKEGLRTMFESMLNTAVYPGVTEVGQGPAFSGDLVALIGLSGSIRGMLMISFPEATALAAVSRLLGMPLEEVDEIVTDGLTEIISVSGGITKRNIEAAKGAPIDLSLPNVLRGDCHQVDYSSDSLWIEAPFVSQLGEFRSRVNFAPPEDPVG